MVKDKLDRPFRDLRISVTDRCNFRCVYCMPAEVYGESYQFLPKGDLLSFEEITRLTKIFVGLGAVKVRLTGGEPLVRKELEKLVLQLSQIKGVSDLAMTTNGHLLSQKADALRDAGLDRVSISLDSLDDAIFRKMNGRKFGTASVLGGIAAAEKAGLTPIKINAVIQRGVNHHSVLEMAKYFKERGHTLRLIEYMDVGTRNGWKLGEVIPAKEIVAIIDAEMPLEPVESGYPGEVASRFRYRDGSSEVGIIASVTEPFCGNCSRLRLSPDGRIYTCLFATNGSDLRRPLRSGDSDDEIKALVVGVWHRREDRYSEERSSLTEPVAEKVEMYHIGG